MAQLPYHLLELSVISAQDIAPLTKKLRTYAVTWINPERKLRTRIDNDGQTNPTWNDQFVFRVDNKFLESETSAVMIEIYTLGWLRDICLGSVRVLISNLIPTSIRERGNSSRRFVALQIRRPSGRPQGILNMGVTLLDNTMKSMPLYRQLSASAVGYQDLVDAQLYKQNDQKTKKNDRNKKTKNNDNTGETSPELNLDETTKANEKVQLQRTLSDSTDLNSPDSKKSGKKGKIVNDGALVVRDDSMVNGPEIGGGLNGPEIGGGKGGNGSVVFSDIGPSPSVVAAAVARGWYQTPLDVPHPPGSSILGDWTLEEEASVEGLKSKIDRWRMELPSVERVHSKNYQKVKHSKPSNHSRRHTEGGDGGFSCFGTACGCEFSINCGGGSGGEGTRRNIPRGYNNRLTSSDGESSLFPV